MITVFKATRPLSGGSRSVLFQLFQILQKTVLSKAVFSVIIENAAN
ncbi:hypothetical protein RUMCAL_02295 [Ruminococcus callidus ATCC 27760]|jgi:hypothetical protein|uniref:Uncharacterized protein n=1 Tax=Ruminococcus callidus ATCC 27760 TaxID=411473 RepID=U2LUX1_9FIRM|nr:hypothetical protein RUMCAL_02295 [Ruminococcus callidus ATCC 27760]